MKKLQTYKTLILEEAHTILRTNKAMLNHIKTTCKHTVKSEQTVGCWRSGRVQRVPEEILYSFLKLIKKNIQKKLYIFENL